mmetsp:Transcript_573/g.1095  ORF Transcript_573/g.1095 Transcript_573/m.1095 type:complete len:95 (+) Transcript_573:1281-1565(+)
MNQPRYLLENADYWRKVEDRAFLKLAPFCLVLWKREIVGNNGAVGRSMNFPSFTSRVHGGNDSDGYFVPFEPDFHGIVRESPRASNVIIVASLA